MRKLAALILMVVSFSAYSTQNVLPTFMDVYPNVVGTELADCMTCHTINKWQRNDYGKDLQKWLRENYDGNEPDPQQRVYSSEFISQGLMAIEKLDSDGDGMINIDEIDSYRRPGIPDAE